MAPEVINTQKKGYNFKIDIWSVGCVVLEMWAGMRPWMGDEVVAVMFKVLLVYSKCGKLLTPACHASFTSPSFLLRYQKTLFCLNWLMISGESVLPCEMIISLAIPS
jgi:serine/threonine protein kinase